MIRLWALIILLVLSACAGSDGDTSIPIEPDGGAGDGAEPPGSSFPVADLTVTIEHPDAETITYQISCSGDVATIDGIDGLPAEAACARLAIPAVQQRLVSPPLPGDLVCTDIYGGPDTARIRGAIEERPVDTTIARTNGCGISDWDNLLADVLPPAIGVTR